RRRSEGSSPTTAAPECASNQRAGPGPRRGIRPVWTHDCRPCVTAPPRYVAAWVPQPARRGAQPAGEARTSTDPTTEVAKTMRAAEQGGNGQFPGDCD